MRRLVILLMLCLIPGLASAAEAVVVAVSSSVLAPTRTLAAQFEERYHIRIKLVSGSTGQLYAQISHGAPYAVFMAADAVVAGKLVRQRNLVATAVVTYATGRLYLCVRQGIPDLHHLIGSIAMAEPRLAPYGRAAEQTLRASSNWPQEKGNVIYTPNVMVAASHLQQGFVDSAFVASSAVVAQKDKSCAVVNEALHAPISHQAVLLTPGPEADAWFTYIRSPEAEVVWKQAGLVMEAS